MDLYSPVVFFNYSMKKKHFYFNFFLVLAVRIQAPDGHRERRRRNQLVLDRVASCAKAKGAPGELAARIQALDGHP